MSAGAATAPEYGPSPLAGAYRAWAEWRAHQRAVLRWLEVVWRPLGSRRLELARLRVAARRLRALRRDVATS